jgi:hypothetical protein
MPNSKKSATTKPATPTPPAKSRKAHRPRIDAIINAILRGDYDDQLVNLRTAIDRRNEARREDVMALVHEVYGDSASVTMTRDEQTTTAPRRNPFTEKAQTEEEPEPELDPEAQPTIVSGSRISQDDEGGVIVSENAGGSDAEMERLGDDHISHSPTFG